LQMSFVQKYRNVPVAELDILAGTFLPWHLFCRNPCVN
jgi:hypothetical protein